MPIPHGLCTHGLLSYTVCAVHTYAKSTSVVEFISLHLAEINEPRIGRLSQPQLASTYLFGVYLNNLEHDN